MNYSEKKFVWSLTFCPKTSFEENAKEVFVREYHYKSSEKRKQYVSMVSAHHSVSNYAWQDIANDKWRLLSTIAITRILTIA
jgi:hypothetical protein